MTIQEMPSRATPERQRREPLRLHEVIRAIDMMNDGSGVSPRRLYAAFAAFSAAHVRSKLLEGRRLGVLHSTGATDRRRWFVGATPAEAPEQPRRRAATSDLVAEYFARGGRVTRCPSYGDGVPLPHYNPEWVSAAKAATARRKAVRKAKVRAWLNQSKAVGTKKADRRSRGDA